MSESSARVHRVHRVRPGGPDCIRLELARSFRCWLSDRTRPGWRHHAGGVPLSFAAMEVAESSGAGFPVRPLVPADLRAMWATDSDVVIRLAERAAEKDPALMAALERARQPYARDPIADAMAREIDDAYGEWDMGDGTLPVSSAKAAAMVRMVAPAAAAVLGAIVAHAPAMAGVLGEMAEQYRARGDQIGQILLGRVQAAREELIRPAPLSLSLRQRLWLACADYRKSAPRGRRRAEARIAEILAVHEARPDWPGGSLAATIGSFLDGEALLRSSPVSRERGTGPRRA